MIYVNKTQLCVFLTIILVLTCITSSVITFDTDVTAVNAEDHSKPTIVIDAGHGGEDGGAVSNNGILEKDINLEIALTLQKFFIQGGFEVVMTRSEDKAIYNSDAVTLREKKVSDIHNRTKICNENINNIFISIHQNKFEQSQYYGTQVFYSQNSMMSSTLAECIRLAIIGTLQNDNSRQCKPATDSVYILKNATVPAVLVECGFLSNPQEEALLKTKQYRNQMAFAIYSGFLEFYYQNF